MFIDSYDTEALSLLLQCLLSLKVLCLLFHCISLSLPPPQVYYMAEGVRLYSHDQEIWRVVTQQHIHKVVSGVMGFLHAVKSLTIKV